MRGGGGGGAGAGVGGKSVGEILGTERVGLRRVGCGCVDGGHTKMRFAALVLTIVNPTPASAVRMLIKVAVPFSKERKT